MLYQTISSIKKNKQQPYFLLIASKAPNPGTDGCLTGPAAPFSAHITLFYFSAI